MTDSTDLILAFLKDVAAHNNREWFNSHRNRYEEARTAFEKIVEELILHIGQFDESVRHLQVKDCTYRFYRDTRFSEDKSPYKRHLTSMHMARNHSTAVIIFISNPATVCWQEVHGAFRLLF